MLQGSLESLCDEHDPSRQSTLHVLQVRIALHRIALHCIGRTGSGLSSRLVALPFPPTRKQQDRACMIR
jgi:hypothetical protein